MRLTLSILSAAYPYPVRERERERKRERERETDTYIKANTIKNMVKKRARKVSRQYE